MIKTVFFFRYPDGVSLEEGERWYLGTHTQEAKHNAKLVKYVTHNVLPVANRPAHFGTEWTRLTELTYDYETPEAYRAWETSPEFPKFTPAPYANGRGFIAEMVCVDVEPEYDLLKEVPQVPK